MDTYSQIKQTLMGINAPSGQLCLSGEVKSVEGSTCTVDVSGIALKGCRLRALIDDNDHVLLCPRIGSQVLLLDLSNGQKRHLLVLSCSEVERVQMQIGSTKLQIDNAGVVINGGELGGMVKINQLTQKLNELVNAYNAHTHTTAASGSITSGTAVATTGTAAATASTAQPFNASDYENTKVKH